MMHCPHCDGRSHGRTSTRLSPTYREATYICQNIACGHVFVVGMEAIRTLRPSALPNPEVKLPIAPPRAKGTPANDNNEPVQLPPAANDTVRIEAG
ncbi:transcriptional regulator [Sphingomonas cavernae]|uniref:Transcriptional regulator n=2 Tax=Sphingomonas cavernae TaxID=2320861 RepID=A0A418WP46_9SPHN|nr:transcriptional regulator [Sphingomonas cavernae]